MREDLNKVLCESPRIGHHGSFRGKRKDHEEYTDLYEDFDDDIPHKGDSSRGRIGIRKIYGWDKKRFNEHLSPLTGWIRKNVGRPWNKAYSELCSVFDKRSVINQHILLHLDQYVKTKDLQVRNGVLCVLENWRYRRGPDSLSYDDRWVPVKTTSWVQWYVDPRDGILKENRAPRVSRRSLSKQHAKERAAASLDVKRVYADGVELERHENGLWYKNVYKEFKSELVEYEEQTLNRYTEEYEIVTKQKWVYPLCRQYDGNLVRSSRVRVEFKALNHKELKFYGIENRPNEKTDSISNARLKRLARRSKKAAESSAEVVTMRPMVFDDGRKGWYIDHPEFYCDLEPDVDTGVWSVFFRDKDGYEGYGAKCEDDSYEDEEDDDEFEMNRGVVMRYVAGVVLCSLALVGLNAGIPYSGWLMFAGIAIVL